ncbi:MAG TPA: cupredoxin family copper-binding protein [Solirubrobacteraceae bacterium]|jgi:plastocyanin|nr:cupredoxin family copper-binding protein [Solirubrobacteraceae bacterium]
MVATAALCAATAFALDLEIAGAASSEVPVTIVSRAYQPPTLTIEDGQTVVWTNRGFTPHTVTALGGEFDSGRLNAGESFRVTFTTPGSFAYKCTIHPSMRGTVTVLAPGRHPAPPQSSLKVRLTRTHGHPALTLIHVQLPAPNAAVLLQLHYPSGRPWRTVRRARLSPEGKATLKLGAGVERRLRVVVQAGGPPLIGKSLAPARA